jgi:hypothetical protein
MKKRKLRKLIGALSRYTDALHEWLKETDEVLRLLDSRLDVLESQPSKSRPTHTVPN